MSNSSIDKILPGAATPSQSGPGSNGNEGVHSIPQRSCITGASPSDCLASYVGHSLGESYPSPEMQSVYSTAPANWARVLLCLFGGGHTHAHTHTHICIYKS